MVERADLHQLRHSDRGAGDRELQHEMEREPRPEPSGADPGIRNIVEVARPDREREHELEEERHDVDLEHRGAAHRDRNLHERLTAHDDRERAHAFDEVVLVDAAFRFRSRVYRRGSTRGGPRSRPTQNRGADGPRHDRGERERSPTPTHAASARASRFAGAGAVRSRGARVHHRHRRHEAGVGQREIGRVAASLRRALPSRRAPR